MRIVSLLPSATEIVAGWAYHVHTRRLSWEHIRAHAHSRTEKRPAPVLRWRIVAF